MHCPDGHPCVAVLPDIGRGVTYECKRCKPGGYRFIVHSDAARAANTAAALLLERPR